MSVVGWMLFRAWVGGTPARWRLRCPLPVIPFPGSSGAHDQERPVRGVLRLDDGGHARAHNSRQVWQASAMEVLLPHNRPKVSAFAVRFGASMDW